MEPYVLVPGHSGISTHLNARTSSSADLFQSVVCIIAVLACQQMRLLSLERFDIEQAKKCMSQWLWSRASEVLTSHRVSHFCPPGRPNLHRRKGLAVSHGPGFHHLQEPDHHRDCLRRGSPLRRQGHTSSSLLVRPDGLQLHGRRLGRRESSHEPGCPPFGDLGRPQDAECRICMDVCQCVLLGRVRPR